MTRYQGLDQYDDEENVLIMSEGMMLLFLMFLQGLLQSIKKLSLDNKRHKESFFSARNDESVLLLLVCVIPTWL